MFEIKTDYSKDQKHCIKQLNIAKIAYEDGAMKLSEFINIMPRIEIAVDMDLEITRYAGFVCKLITLANQHIIADNSKKKRTIYWLKSIEKTDNLKKRYDEFKGFRAS